jgi:DNA anti-recombination protein RmuC
MTHLENQVEDLSKTSKEIHKILIELSTSMRFYSEKLEDVTKRITANHTDLEVALKSVVSENKTQTDEIKDLKKSEVKAEKAFDWKMKFLFGTGAAAGGAILSFVVEYFKKKFGG